MESQKQVIFPGIVSLLVFTLLFFMVRSFYQEQYITTEKKLLGIEQISILYNVSSMIKNNIFINKIKPDIKNQSEILSLIPNADIIEKLKKLNNQKINNYFLEFIKQENQLSKEKIKKKYILALKILENEIFYIADISSLNLESQRDIAFLISITLQTLPKTIKTIKNISDINLNTLYINKKQKHYKFIINENFSDFSSDITNISKKSLKILSNYNQAIDPIIENIISEFKILQTILINKSISKQNSLSYFLKLSKINSFIDSLFITTKELLVYKLKERKESVAFKIKNGTRLYILLMILTLIVMYINYTKSKKLLMQVNKKNKDDKYISELKEMLLTIHSLRDMCEVSIEQLVKNFNAVNGILYIYDDKNYKLYLGGTYGIKHSNAKSTLHLHDNLIGDCIIDQQLQITQTDLDIDNNGKKIKIKEIVSIPLINLDKSIGAVQLCFNNTFNNNEINFLKRIMYIMSNNIYQSEQDNETKYYLKLIDKNIMIVKSDLNGTIIDVSEEFCNLSKFNKDELIGQSYRIFKHNDTSQLLYVELWRTIKQGISWRGEIKNKAKDGSFYWTDNIIVPNYDINENIVGYTSIKHNISDRKLIEELSITDALTDLFNRRYFDEVFRKKILIARRENKKIALAIIDIDYFKQFNDTYGHQAGDKALQAVANDIKSKMFRPNDYCFRIGGEEFAMLCYYTDKNSILDFFNRVRESIRNLKITHNGHYSSRYITVSIGVKFIKDNELNDACNAFKEADDALYRAKNLGRNRVISV